MSLQNNKEEELNKSYSLEQITKASNRLLKLTEEIITPNEVLNISLTKAKKAINILHKKGLEIEDICKLFNSEFETILPEKCTNDDMQNFINTLNRSTKKRVIKSRN